MSYKESMYRISWITPSFFVDVDLPIIAELQKEVEIYWQVLVLGKMTNDIRFYIEHHLNKRQHIKYEYVEIPYRVFDPRTMVCYHNVLKRAKAFTPDFYYTSDGMAPFGPLLYRLYIPRNKTVAACHNVSTPKGANQEFYSKIFTDLHLRTFRNIQVFSESQLSILNQKFPNKNVLLAPLAIKDYGEPSKSVKDFDENNIIFLFFGIVAPYKRLDLLIEAAQDIYERGYKNFKVRIVGDCKNWSDYSAIIKYPEIFETRIERIPNSDVADLFSESDYFVMPYQDIAQSGAITVAYRYNLPIILSNLPQFKPFGEDGKTGFFFEKESVSALEGTMIQAIEGGKPLYDKLSMGLTEFVESRYSTPAIAKKYLDFFDSIRNS